MLWTKFKNQQKEHEKTKIYTFQKTQSHKYAAVQMVWWLSSVSSKLCQTACTDSNPVWAKKFFYAVGGLCAIEAVFVGHHSMHYSVMYGLFCATMNAG